MKKIIKQQRALLFVLLLSFGFGGVLAKLAPLKNSGLSTAFKQEQPKVVKQKKQKQLQQLLARKNQNRQLL